MRCWTCRGSKAKWHTCGRTSIPPESALRLMLAGLYAGIKKDHALMREAQVNLAIRWFAGYNLGDTLPDHNDQWVDATLAENPGDHTPEPTPPEPAPRGKSKRKSKRNKNHGRHKSHTNKPKKRSTTDPDATFTTNKKGQRMEPSYKQHTVVDDTCCVIVDVEITTGENSEGEMLLHTIDRAQEVLGQPIHRVTADAAYAHSANYAALEGCGIDAAIPPQKPSNINSPMPASRFKFDAKHQHVVCPQGKNSPPEAKSKRLALPRQRRRRGMVNVAIQAYLTAIVINGNRLATFLHCLLTALKAYYVVSIAPCVSFRPQAVFVSFSNYLSNHVQKDLKLAARSGN